VPDFGGRTTPTPYYADGANVLKARTIVRTIQRVITTITIRNAAAIPAAANGC